MIQIAAASNLKAPVTPQVQTRNLDLKMARQPFTDDGAIRLPYYARRVRPNGRKHLSQRGSKLFCLYEPPLLCKGKAVLARIPYVDKFHGAMSTMWAVWLNGVLLRLPSLPSISLHFGEHLAR